jgi:hypothetical protein
MLFVTLFSLKNPFVNKPPGYNHPTTTGAPRNNKGQVGRIAFSKIYSAFDKKSSRCCNYIISEEKVFAFPAFYHKSLRFFIFFFFFASRPPLGSIDDGAGGFAQRGRAALCGNDGEQCLYGLEKFWPLGACKGSQRCRQFFKLSSLG